MFRKENDLGNVLTKVGNIDCSDTMENKGKPNWLSVGIKPDRTALLYVGSEVIWYLDWLKQ